MAKALIVKQTNTNFTSKYCSSNLTDTDALVVTVTQTTEDGLLRPAFEFRSLTQWEEFVDNITSMSQEIADELEKRKQERLDRTPSKVG